MAVEDATVADVTERTNVPVFNRIAQALTQDVVALLPTAGADDLDGCEAAASAVHRSVASGAQTDDVASAKRVEQGLRRLAVSIDKTSPAAGCKTHELLEMLAGYVQAGTMLARRKRQSIPKDSATTDAIGDDAAKDAMDVDGASSSRMDEVQSERASRAMWRLADALAHLDAGVAAASRSIPGANGSPTSTGPAAADVAAASLDAVKRALAALPTDHLAPVFPDADPRGDAPPGLHADPKSRAIVDAVADELRKEYALRKETVARRAGVTVQSFSYSKRLRDQPEVARDFLRRAGAGGTQAQGRDGLPVGGGVSIADVKRAKTADLARCILRTNAEAHRVLDASVKRVLIGNVPDRGGRTGEARGAGGGHMPEFTARVAGGGGATHHGGGRGRGGRQRAEGARGRGGRQETEDARGRGGRPRWWRRSCVARRSRRMTGVAGPRLEGRAALS